jgi:hypothetical protein
MSEFWVIAKREADSDAMADPTLDQLLETLRHSDDGNELFAAFEAVDRVAREHDVPVLLHALAEEDNFYLREAVAAPLIRFRGLAVLQELLDAHELGLRERHDNDTLDSLIMDLVEKQPHEAAPMLLAMLNDRSSQRRQQGAWLLGFASDATNAEPLLRALKDRSSGVRSAAVGSLPMFAGQPPVFEGVVAAARDLGRNSCECPPRPR